MEIAIDGKREKEKKRILIIDDDLDNLQLSKDVLQFNGFETYDFIDPRLARYVQTESSIIRLGSYGY